MYFRNFLNSIKNNNIREVKSFLKKTDFDPTQFDNLAIESAINSNADNVFDILIKDKRFNLSAKDNNALFYSIQNNDVFYFNLLISNKSVINHLSTKWIEENSSIFKNKKELKEKLKKIINIENF